MYAHLYTRIRTVNTVYNTIEGLDADNVSLTTINLIDPVTFSSKRSFGAGQYLETCHPRAETKKNSPT